MVYFKLFGIITMLCIINDTTAFKCWCCSSDEPDSEFCGQFLDESSLSHYQKAVNLVDCTYPHFDLTKIRDQITKCLIKTSTSNNGKVIYSRSCVWEERNAPKDTCLTKTPSYGHRIDSCETCSGDKCNYRFSSDSHDGSTHLVALYEILFICLVIVLQI